MARISPLFAVTQRLTLTPTTELPAIASFLASAIGNCSDVLTRSPDRGSKDVGDESLLVHKLKTRISSLLQDRSPQGRWTGVILFKATVEAGGWRIVNESSPWIRHLLTILGKSDPIATKNACIISITRAFLIAQKHPTLVREIVNQLLPAFISACLSQLDPSVSTGKPDVALDQSSLSAPVFQSFNELLPRYPSLFRPFLSKIQPLLLLKIGSSSNSDTVHVAACRVLVLLHHSSPKNMPVTRWSEACAATVSAIHCTADQLFRAVLEDWDEMRSNRRTKSQHDYSQEVHGIFDENIKLPDWTGVYEGAERLRSLLRLLTSFLTVTTSEAMPFAIGQISNCLSRLLNIAVPKGDKPLQSQMRINPEISKLEQEELFAVLPGIHLAALKALKNIFENFGDGLLSVVQILLDQALHVFEAEQAVADIRAESYCVLGKALPLWAPSASKQRISQIADIVLSCCKDILPEQPRAAPSTDSAQNHKHSPHTNGKSSGNVEPLLKLPRDPNVSNPSSNSPARRSALNLLPLLLTHLPARHTPPALRKTMDRTAILAGHKEAMLASVLNPMPDSKGKYSTPSIMPFFARACQGDLLAEGVLRPRMPVIPAEQGDMTDDVEDSGSDETNHQFQPEPWSLFEASNDGKGTGKGSSDENAKQDRQATMNEQGPSNAMDALNGFAGNLEVDGARRASEPSNRAIDASPDLEFPSRPSKRALGSDLIAADPLNNAAEPSLEIENHQRKRVRLEQDATQVSGPSDTRTFSSTRTETAVLPDVKGKGKAVTAEQTKTHEKSGENFGGGRPSRASTKETEIARGIGNDDDESDFEMPTINMEMDTEDEDEEGEEFDDENEDEEDERDAL